MIKEQICKECGSGFIKKHRWVYCSADCRNKSREKRDNQRREAGLSNGMINGRAASKHYYLLYQRSAKSRELLFTLSESEYMDLWQKPCYYCGSDIRHVGIDRVDNLKGYESGNVVPCCTKCNKMKRSYTQKEFLDTCISIAKIHG